MTRLFLFIIGVFMAYSSAKGQQENSLEYFELAGLSRKNAETDNFYYQFLDKKSLSMGLYELSTEDKDGQKPHQLDEIYYIAEGKALLTVGEEVIEVQQGSIVYVRAQIPHHFFEITEDLKVLVIFSKTDPSTDGLDWLAFDLDELTQMRKNDENVWNSFLDVSTMRMGLYMLPESLGGDSALTHKVDEVNIVVSGLSKFKAGEKEVEVQPGSIFYVEGGVGHRFYSIKEESVDVLVLFPVK